MNLDDLIANLAFLSDEDRDRHVRAAMASTASYIWKPNPGPQTQAYFSLADLLLFGGQGGGGKSDLGVGVAFNDQLRSLILRRKYADLDALTERAIAINGTRDGFSAAPRPKLRTGGGRLIAFGANQHRGDEHGFQGQPFDYKYFDEGTQFLEEQIRFHLGWIRTVEKGQRTRAIIGSNPPIDATGDWIVGMFRPWLDLTHANPAQDGELRWFITDRAGNDVEVDGPAPIERGGEKYIPQSRTFIRSRVGDNPYLVNTDYQAKLDAMPEPLRSAVRDGNFMAARPDVERQVIPLAWIIAAQQRWDPDGYKKFRMTAMAIDPAGGGIDAEEMIYRHGGWFSEPITRRGEMTADGAGAAAQVVTHRRHNCPVVVDSGGGYGGAVTLRLKDNGIEAVAYVGAAKVSGKTRDAAKLSFVNKRSQDHWRVREALDPNQEGGSVVALPPSPELRADLAAPTWELTLNGIKVESKDDIKERLGRSPGKGDAVVMCLAEGERAVLRQQYGNRGQRSERANVGFDKLKQMGR